MQCVCNVWRSSTLLTLLVHKTLCGGHLRGCEMMTYFLSRIWLPGFIKIGSKEASFPFDFNEGSVADRRLLIYTLLLRALRQTEQDPAVASHSSAHTHTHLHLYAPQALPLFIVKYGGPEIYTDARMNNKYIHLKTKSVRAKLPFTTESTGFIIIFHKFENWSIDSLSFTKGTAVSVAALYVWGKHTYTLLWKISFSLCSPQYIHSDFIQRHT